MRRDNSNERESHTGTVVGSEAISQRIIGRGIRVGDGGFRCGRLFRSENRDLALADQPLRQHGGSIFIEPLIEKRGYLLPQIGGVAEPREFAALRSIA